MRTLISGFGIKFVLFLTLIYGCIKGIAYQALLAVMLPYYKNSLKVSAVDYQKFYNVAAMAFAIKPLLGTISDSLPIMGYHKRPYLVFLFTAGTACLLSAAFLPKDPSSGPSAAGLFFIVVLAVAGSDLMCEGKYSEIMVKKKETGSTVVTWVWLCVMSGSVIAAGLEGPLADYANPNVVIFILVPLLIIPVVPTLLGWLPEHRVRNNAIVSPGDHGAESIVIGKVGNDQRSSSSSSFSPRLLLSPAAMKHKGIAMLSVLTSFVALGMVVISLLVEKQYPTLIYVGICVVILQIISFNVLPRAAACANLFMFCKELLYVQINGPLDYFYTATPECLLGGPHFSFTYYQTFANIASAAGGLLGVALFQRFLSTQNFRVVFWFTTMLKIVAAFFDLMIVQRWNTSIGIPDKATYIFGDAIVAQVAMMLDFMPVAVLMSKLCPKGLEATMYALLAGFANFGQVCSRSIGGMITEALDIKATVPCNFTDLWQLVVVSHMILPLAVIPLSIALIPNKTMKDSILSPQDGGDEADEAEVVDSEQPRDFAESDLDDDTPKKDVVYKSKPSSPMFSTSTPLDEGLLPPDRQLSDM